MEEIWRPVIGYEKRYLVSNLGRIMSLNYMHTGQPNIMSPCHKNRSSKYYRILLYNGINRKSFPLYQIVAFAFPEICGKWFNGAVINHKDQNPENNRADNLEWCTIRYNNTYGDRIYRASKSNKKNIIAFDNIHTLGTLFNSTTDAANYLGINKSGICNALKGKAKTCCGYRWEYI